jgi:hypothetical protein
MRITIEEFFNNYELPEKGFYYDYCNQKWEVPVQEVIKYLRDDKEVQRSLWIMKELNADTDFVVNNYLQDIADDFIEWQMKQRLIDELEDKFYNTNDDVYFNIREKNGEIVQFVFYKDDEDRYHIQEVDIPRDLYAGYKGISKITSQLRSIIKDSSLDITRVV